MDKQKLHNCPKCSRKFLKLPGLKIHMKYFHKNNEQIKINKEAVKNNDNELETLVKSKNSSPCICKLCSQTFSTISNLKTHTATIHEKQKRFQCHICSKFYCHRNGLQYHISSIHQKIKPHQCSFCAKSFSSKGYLKKHIESLHKNLKENVCRICNKGFRKKQDLTNHTNRYH